jgi:integrase
VPIPDFGVIALREQRSRQEQERRFIAREAWEGAGDNGPLAFTTVLGGPLDPGEVSRGIHRLLAPIGMATMRFHDLRHGCATLLLRNGVSIPVIAKILGHSTPTTTWNVYAHVADDSMQDAAGRLDAVVSGL